MPLTYEMLRDEPGFAVKVYRRGTDSEYFSAWCPFHADQEVASLMVYRDGEADPQGRTHYGYWKCLAGCGVGGLDALWRKHMDWSKKNGKSKGPRRTAMSWRPPHLPTDPDALLVLVQAAHEILRKYPDLGWYIKQRGIEGQIIPRHLGYHNGWISIPVFDEAGSLETVILRSTPPVQMAGGQRFHCPSESVSTLYIPDRSLYNRSKKVAIVFGMFDALTLAELLVPCATPIHGNGSIYSEQLTGKKKFIIIPDEPEHEYKEAHALALSMLNEGKDVELVKFPYPEGTKDTNDFLIHDKKKDLEKILSRWF